MGLEDSGKCSISGLSIFRSPLLQLGMRKYCMPDQFLPTGRNHISDNWYTNSHVLFQFSMPCIIIFLSAEGLATCYAAVGFLVSIGVFAADGFHRCHISSITLGLLTLIFPQSLKQPYLHLQSADSSLIPSTPPVPNIENQGLRFLNVTSRIQTISVQ